MISNLDPWFGSVFLILITISIIILNFVFLPRAMLSLSISIPIFDLNLDPWFQFPFLILIFVTDPFPHTWPSFPCLIPTPICYLPIWIPIRNLDFNVRFPSSFSILIPILIPTLNLDSNPNPYLRSQSWYSIPILIIDVFNLNPWSQFLSSITIPTPIFVLSKLYPRSSTPIRVDLDSYPDPYFRSWNRPRYLSFILISIPILDFAFPIPIINLDPWFRF
jgi:hypothetical protein